MNPKITFNLKPKFNFIWVDYLIIAWFFIFVIVWITEAYYNQLNRWTIAIYLIVWGILMIIKSFVKEKLKKTKNEKDKK